MKQVLDSFPFPFRPHNNVYNFNPSLYAPAINKMALYAKYDDKNVRWFALAQIAYIARVAWHFASESGGLETVYPSRIRRERVQEEFGRAVKTMSHNVVKILFDGTCDRQSMNRHTCIVELATLLSKNYPMTDEEKAKIIKRVVYLEKRDRSMHVREGASMFVKIFVNDTSGNVEMPVFNWQKTVPTPLHNSSQEEQSDSYAMERFYPRGLIS